MAISAFHRMDVVRTLERLEGRVHLLDVEAAIGELRMAGSARDAGGLAVFPVAGEAAEAFVDSDRSAVIAGSDLGHGRGRVTLVAERLALIGTEYHSSSSVLHLRQGQA